MTDQRLAHLDDAVKLAQRLRQKASRGCNADIPGASGGLHYHFRDPSANFGAKSLNRIRPRIFLYGLLQITNVYVTHTIF